MAKVHILNVTVHNNPAPFFTPFQFEIHFECLEELQDDLEFKIIYVGSAETYEFDQVLDQIVVDAVPQGQFKFMFQADPPDTSKIPGDDAVGVTVVLITASYREQEFVRVGYYVTNEYEDMELRENPPVEPQFNKLIRTIAANEPRVTKFKINWDSATSSNVQAETANNVETTDVQATSSNATTSNANGNDVDMLNVNSTNANANSSYKTNESQPQPSSSSSMTAPMHNNHFENKENILLKQQQQKFISANSSDKSDVSSQNLNSNNFIETSYDSMMN